MRTFRSLMAGVILVATAGIASATPIVCEDTGCLATLEEVTEAGGIQIGDKLFTGISQDSYIDDADVDIAVGLDGNNYFIAFLAGWDTLDAGGDFDFRIMYKVETVSGQPLIYAIDAAIVGTAGQDGGSITMSEFVKDGPTLFDSTVGISNLVIDGDTEDPPAEVNDTLTLIGGPYAELWVVKDIDLNQGACTATQNCGESSVSVIGQSFHQVPEPGTMMLLGSGLLGLAGLGRRRMKRS